MAIDKAVPDYMLLICSDTLNDLLCMLGNFSCLC